MYQDLISHPTEGDFSHIAPYRVFSFDIECCAEKGGFPEPERDAVITIANVITEQVKMMDMMNSRVQMRHYSNLYSQCNHVHPFLVWLYIHMKMKQKCYLIGPNI